MGKIAFKDSLRLNNSLGLIFFVATFDANLSKSLKDDNVSRE